MTTFPFDCLADVTADELQATIDRAEEKRRELENDPVGTAQSSKVFALLPKAAELYRQQIAFGMDGNPTAAIKARTFLREWFGGQISIESLADGGLMAHWSQNVGARA